MRVKIQAQVTNEDGVYDPGQYVDLRDALAHIFITNQWAVDPAGQVYRARDGTLVFKKPEEPEKAEGDEPIETAAFEGAPEAAVGRRQRGRPRAPA